jgi:hypothetical protein
MLNTFFCHTSLHTSPYTPYIYLTALGAQAPLGFWDPLGLLKEADEERFDRLRYVEVKHGRISMLAILGHLVTTAGNRLPGDIAYGVPFSGMKSGLAAFDTIPAAGSLQLLLFIGLMELGFAKVQGSIEEDCASYMTGTTHTFITIIDTIIHHILTNYTNDAYT